MFGFSSGDNVTAVVRKRRYMAEAQQRWPFLTSYNARTIKTPQQLVTMVREGSSLSQEDAEEDVLEWLVDKDF